MIRVLFTLLLVATPGLSQETVRVVNTEDRPLPFVLFRTENSENWVISDEFGMTELPREFSNNDSIIIERLGYVTIWTSYSELVEHSAIVMIPEPIHLAAIHITRPKNDNKNRGNIVSLPTIESTVTQSYKHYFSRVPGVSIKSYGGPGSVSTLSINGGSSSNAKILIDGFDLTNTQNGEMDLSQLPLPFIQSARIVTGGLGLHGSGSTDGVVYLEPWWNRTGLTVSAGSYGHSSIAGMLLMKESKRTARILAGIRRDGGDFPVEWKDRSFTRKNNDFYQEFVGFQYNHLFSGYSFLKILSLISDQERGVPGTVWAPSTARRNDRLMFTGATVGILRERQLLHLKLLSKSSDEHYQDPWYGIESKHKIKSHTISLSQEIDLDWDLLIKNIFKIQKDELNSSDAGNRSRTAGSNSFSLFYGFTDKLSVSGHNRIEVEQGASPVITWGGTIRYIPEVLALGKLVINMENGYRRPSFNELYWNPGGNPDLLPENNSTISGTITLNTTGWSEISFTGFYTHSKNLIQWLPYVYFWRPVNISSATRSGIKGLYKWELFSRKLTGSLSASHIISKNHQNGPQDGKPLRYVPEFSGYFQVNLHLGRWMLTGDIQHTGRILSNYDWPEDIYLPPVTTGNAGVTYTKDARHGTWKTTLSIENLANVQYQSMLGYPEMGRSLKLTQKWEQK